MSSSNKEALDVKELGNQICQIFVPTILSSLYSCILLQALNTHRSRLGSYESIGSLSFFGKAFEGIGVSIGTRGKEPSFIDHIYVVLIFCGIIVAITLIVLLLFYLRLHGCLKYYFYFPTILILTFITPLVLREVLTTLNGPVIDAFTILILTWNFTALGLMAIFSIYAPTPLCLQQLYLVHDSAILAVIVIHILPGWAPWLLLGFLIIWDIFAVLAPFGPLNLILNMAEREGLVDMPGLVYTTEAQLQGRPKSNINDDVDETQQIERITNEGGANNEANSPDNKETKSAQMIKTIDSEEKSPKPAADEENSDKERAEQIEPPMRKSSNEIGDYGEISVNVGLGDFVFYSLLVGLTSRFADQYAALTAIVSILVGIIVTITILVLARRALPAIPISVSLALITSCICKYTVPQLSNALASNMIFV